MTPDNIVQHGLHLAQANSPIPWMTMSDLVAKAIESDGRKKVGIIGTKLVTMSSTYQTHLGLKGIQVIARHARGRAAGRDHLRRVDLWHGGRRAVRRSTG